MEKQLERVKKHKNYLFTNRGTKENPDWIRVKTSTDFALTFNAETETFDYIADENPSDELKSYKPTIGQTQTAYIGDFVFDYIFDFAFEQKAGMAAVTEGMVVFQQKNENGEYAAWRFDMGVTIDTYDLVSGTLSYQMGVRGTVERGSATIDTDGKPLFALN